MAKYDFGGGCPCGLHAECEPGCSRAPLKLSDPVPSLPRYEAGRLVPAPRSAPDTKPSNPKDMVGSSKLPLHLWPETATAMGCLGLLDGMLKYGRSNWRRAGVRATIYADAIRRHLAAWLEGEDFDPDSGVPHMAHLLACAAIIVDAQAAGKFVDDRQTPGGYRALVDGLTPHVERLKALHEGKSPKHYTIADKPGEGEAP